MRVPRLGRQAGRHVVGVAVRHRAHDRQPMRDLGRLRQQLAELHARQSSWRSPRTRRAPPRAVRLGIERLLLRMPAVQIQHDDLLGPAKRRPAGLAPAPSRPAAPAASAARAPSQTARPPATPRGRHPIARRLVHESLRNLRTIADHCSVRIGILSLGGISPRRSLPPWPVSQR